MKSKASKREDNRLYLRVNSIRLDAWKRTAEADGRSLSGWAERTLSAEKEPLLAKTSHKDRCDTNAMIYYLPENRALWEARALAAGLELTEWVRRVLDHRAGQK